MDSETLSRAQFGLTTSFHYIYPPISMGLGVLLVVIGIIYVRTRNPLWRELSVFWVKVYGLVFALGIATGVVQEFEFGMNWAAYSRFVGNIFGSLLAAEGVFAFFLEGGFLGLMLFGGSRLGPRMWLLATFFVVFGAHFSALWIVMANSWMQTPSGYHLQQAANGPNGQIAVMTSFASVVFTPSFGANIFHVYVSAWMVGASLMLSVSAYYLLRQRHVEHAKAGIAVALPFFAVLSVLQVFVFGTWVADMITAYQPTKLAGMEGLWPSHQNCAPLVFFGWVDQPAQTTVGPALPCLLSFLAYGSRSASVTGLDDFPSSTWPPLQLVFQAYHLMIDAGMLFILIGLLGVVFYYWGRRLFRMAWLLWILVITVALTELATLAGWWTSEFGRQPWIVYGLLHTEDGVSPTLTSAQVLFSLVVFIVLYLILLFVFLFLLNARIHRGIEPLEEPVSKESLPDSFREVFRRPRPHRELDRPVRTGADPAPAPAGTSGRVRL
jgi:cytochrome d ubiquinol oxidase subunit I